MGARRRVTLSLHPRVAEAVERLYSTGLYGLNRTKVVEGLFLIGLRAEMPPIRLKVKR